MHNQALVDFVVNRANKAKNDLLAIFETKEFQEALAQELGSRMTAIFTFGSNLKGVHGKGAALTARRSYGAQVGVGEGLTGNAYAIPTKDHQLKPRKLEDIAKSVEEFKEFARKYPNLSFKVTKIGCGLAGFSEDQIKPMFKDSPQNCELPHGWRENVG